MPPNKKEEVGELMFSLLLMVQSYVSQNLCLDDNFLIILIKRTNVHSQSTTKNRKLYIIKNLVNPQESLYNIIYINTL